jgi:hypothetical protein
MTTVLHIPAQLGAPVACDMSTARDTPNARLAAYGALFDRALVRRQRRADGLAFTFRGDAGTREAVEDLVRREAACCPFLDYRIEVVGGEVIWTMTNVRTGHDRALVELMLDVFHALPDRTGSDSEGLADRGVEDEVRSATG